MCRRSDGNEDEYMNTRKLTPIAFLLHSQRQVENLERYYKKNIFWGWPDKVVLDAPPVQRLYAIYGTMMRSLSSRMQY